MPDDLATSNVNRSYSLSATSIAIFTFTLVFLYPRFASGEIDGLLFQATLVVMGVATFRSRWRRSSTTALRSRTSMTRCAAGTGAAPTRSG